MPDINERYTLTEIAKELNVVPTFINRVQRETRIGPSIGTRGKAVSFEKKYVSIFRMVKALRTIGFSFEDIKMLWQHEENILKIEGKLFDGSISKFPLKPDACDARSIKLVLHNGLTCYSGTIDDLQVKDPYSKEYPVLLETLNKRKQEIIRRRDVFAEDLKKMREELDAILVDNR